MKPCVIYYNKLHSRFEAVNEFGRMFAFNAMSFHMLALAVEEDGYELVPLNSRFARTILDRRNQHHI